MAKASSRIELAAPAADVWQLVGGFDSLPCWLPFIPQSKLSEGGRVRHLVGPGGAVIVERLMSFDERARSYTYHILQSPFPQKDYLSTLKVRSVDGSDNCIVEWSGEFTPDGATEQEVSALFQSMYDDGLKSLKARFEVTESVQRVCAE